MKSKPRKNSDKYPAQPDQIQAAIDHGIDITMLIDNLNRTPTERIKRHQIALVTVEKLRKAQKT